MIPGIPAARIVALNSCAENRQHGKWVVYWMSAAQRAESNPALEFALHKSNEHELPLIVLFCLTDKYPEAYERHYAFMLEGLVEVSASLRQVCVLAIKISCLPRLRKPFAFPCSTYVFDTIVVPRQRCIKFAVLHGSAPTPILAAARQSSCVITDCGYTRTLRHWRKRLADELSVAVFEVEGEVLVPAHLLSDRHDTVAATFRPRLARMVKDYLFDVEMQPVCMPSLDLDLSDVIGSKDTIIYDLDSGVEKILAALDIDRCVPRVCAGGGGNNEALRGGASEAQRHLFRFLSGAEADEAEASSQLGSPKRRGTGQRVLKGFSESRNDPSLRKQSHLSPYLHFGQISIVAVAIKARDFAAANPQHQRDIDVFWDELIIRREFAVHFVVKHPETYDSLACLPQWAMEGLRKHETDKRTHLYSAEQLERGKTHDLLWNAAQLEMVVTGKMHNYMRM